MTRSFKYLGPFDEVEVPAVGVTVARGAVLVVDDPEVAAGFDGQTDSWAHVPAKKKAAKKAAAKKAAPAKKAAAAPTPDPIPVVSGDGDADTDEKG